MVWHHRLCHQPGHRRAEVSQHDQGQPQPASYATMRLVVDDQYQPEPYGHIEGGSPRTALSSSAAGAQSELVQVDLGGVGVHSLECRVGQQRAARLLRRSLDVPVLGAHPEACPDCGVLPSITAAHLRAGFSVSPVVDCERASDGARAQ